MIVLGSRVAGKRASRLRGALFFCPPDFCRRPARLPCTSISTPTSARPRPLEERASELALLASVTLRQHRVRRACRRSPTPCAGRSTRLPRRRLAIGAHPGYADRDGFGRRELTLPPARSRRSSATRCQLLASIASAAGVRLVHVKPHGALYNQAVRDRALASAIADAVRQADADPALRGPVLAHRCSTSPARPGCRVAAEAFADRAYQPDGSLVPRSRPGAVIEHADAVAAQARDVADGAPRDCRRWVR